MDPSQPEGTEELRVLVLAPVGRDAELTCEMLAADGVACHACTSLADLDRELRVGAGAILVAAEALGIDGPDALERMLKAQEAWSDIPIVLATAGGDAYAREVTIGRLERAGSLTVLERPVRLVTMRTVIRAALEARKRQYEIRGLLEELRVTVARLDAEREVRERFVSLLAHDLRGPLSAASLAARMLVARPASLDDRRNLAGRIERSIERIDQMVQDLLDANRIRAGNRLPLNPQPCDLVEIAADVVADLDEEDQQRVRVIGPERLEGVWSPDQLRRALWNLISNALKYGAAETPVEVRLTRSAEEAALAVQNEGSVIPEEEQARIFEPFGRARGAETQARGWGLGLTLVRGCAESHGGSLELTSTREGGTTFTVRLPLDARP